MPRKDPAKVAAKWKQRLQSSQQEYVDSINALDKSPMEEAIKKKETMRTRVNQALDNGDWERGLRRVTLQEYKDKATKVGARRLSEGASAAEGKVTDFMGEFLDFADRTSQEIRNMPNATDEDRKARMLRNFDLMKQFKQRRS